MKKTVSAIITAAMLAASMPVIPHAAEDMSVSAVLPYQDTSLSFEERAADLVSRMTLEEKVAQTGRSAPAISRLGVSKYNYWREGIHGVARQGQATSFPSSLAMSNTWDVELMREVMDITGNEARAKNPRYDLSYWNPTINMARDPRWGRNEESYGEDPYLTGQLASAAVKGMQGDDEKYLKTIATLKHFAANNCEGERQTGTSVMSESTLRDYYMKAFETTVADSNPMSVMSSYNGITMTRNGETVIDYIASSANKYILTDALRRTYGFNGYVVGDCGAWENLFGRQSLRQKLFPDWNLDDITAAMTTGAAYNAGSNLDCGARAQTSGYDAIVEGWADEATLDRAVYELFLARMKTGEFDEGARYQDTSASIIEKDESVAKAEQAAEESWVLLENNGALPMKETDGKKIAVVGNLAGEVTLGDYSGEPTKTSTPIDGIRSAFPNAEVSYLGNVNDSTPLFNISRITLILSDGKTRSVDLTKATNVRGMDSGFKNVTKSGYAVIPSIDFSNVAQVKIEGSTISGAPKASVNIGYSNATQTVSVVDITGAENTAEYTGATGGYNETADMYITVSASAEFSVDSYKTALDEADYIIAYGGTTTADSSESHDRGSIEIPASQKHVAELCGAYPEKTIVALSTVGQVNVESIKDRCAAMLWTSYNGQCQGEALGKVLNGTVNPSGKLSTTWYKAADLDKMPLGSPRQSINNVYYNFTSYEIAQAENFPGRTYQYHSGTPVYPFGYGKSYTGFEYSNITVDETDVDVDSSVTVTVDVRNTGETAGAEVVQLYVTAPGADGVTLPLRQLKGFTRVSLDAGETKTVSLTVDMADNCFFDEAAQKNYVPTGMYTITVGGSSTDAAQQVNVNVSGELSDGLKLVKAIPSGIKVIGADNGSEVKPAKDIEAGVSAALKNDALVYDLSNYSVNYASSNTNVATVEGDGIVKAGNTAGAATITVTVSDGENTVTDTFPVVNEIKTAASDSEKASYLSELKSAYEIYPEAAFEPEDYEELTEIYEAAKQAIEAELLAENLPGLLKEAKERLADVPRIELTESYSITAENNVIENRRIDYSTIGEYTAATSSISGTYTKENPYTVKLTAIKGGNAVAGIVWDIKKLDASSRKAAEINAADGTLTVYENGVYEITANNYTDRECGSLIIHANLQLEAENADDGGGMNLTDGSDGKRGGASQGLCAGSTKTYWARFDGVKLNGLKSITYRAASKSADAVLNASLSASEDRLIGSTTLSATGDWNNWAEVTAEIDKNELAKVITDENGCASIYVQVNGANLDFIRLNYIDSEIDIVSLAGGKVRVSVPYESGVVIDAKHDENGVLTGLKIYDIVNGSCELSGYSEGDTISLMVWDGLNSMKALGKSVTESYKKPPVKALTVFNFGDSAFDSFFETSDGLKLTSGTGMDGIGGWQTTSSKRTYTYDGKEYTFTRALKGGAGSSTVKNVYFTPEADGVITVLFDASSDRKMIAEQNGVKVEKYGTASGVLTPLEMAVKEGEVVYIYGGGSNKNLYGVIYDTTKTSVEEQATPEPTAAPTPIVVPETSYTQKIEFEDYTAAWTGKSNKKAETNASSGYVVENTVSGDIFYFGNRAMDKLTVLDIIAGVRASAGDVTAEFFAVDTGSMNVADASKSDIEKLLTSQNSLGKVGPLVTNPSAWNDFQKNTVVTSGSRTGSMGIFVRLTTTGSYCGNIDYISLGYTD